MNYDLIETNKEENVGASRKGLAVGFSLRSV
jgi:hypothetical protein